MGSVSIQEAVHLRENVVRTSTLEPARNGVGIFQSFLFISVVFKATCT